MKNHNKNLEKCFAKAGIMPYFFDERGVRKYASKRIKKAILKSFNGQIQVPSSPLPPVKILRENQPHFIRLNLADRAHALQGKWTLIQEDQTVITGKVKKNTISLPRELPLGYHQLVLEYAKKHATCSVIVAPQRCYQPDALLNKQKLWGTFLQLYTLRSEQNWGVGDFGDLYQFIQQLAPYQADFIGLNPIHALFPANPDSASPYSPSSRRWLNILYIDLNQLPEFQQSEAAQRWFTQADTQAQLAKVRAEDWVNYAEVMALKLKALSFAFEFFQQHAQTARQQAFATFCEQGGESLQIQATFDALHAHLMAEMVEQWGWDVWPEAYQAYQSEAVERFKQEHPTQIQFYAWLQCIADEQLARCHALCTEQHMKVGMYRDLAVGVTGNGAETWAEKTLFCLNASVGAPPDVLGPQGQNWGLTPMNPHILQQQAYRPFIELVRTNMRHCRALRIDHIMSLLRLWWIPKGDSAVNGAYVRYPVDELIAILALESQRHQCLIIGEDLGTVPKQIISKLKNAGILSYKIFYFEFDHEGNSRAMHDYPYQAMTTLSTHDLPTLHGYWRGYDFELGQRYGVYPNPKILTTLQQDRVEAKRKILTRLQQAHIEIEAGINERLTSHMSKQFAHQLQTYVSQVSSALFGLQPEDWLAMTEPVNIPGTSTEYANWRRRLTANITTLFADQDIQQLLQRIKENRTS